MSSDYSQEFDEVLKEAKSHPFGWYLAHAGSQPVMIMYTGGEIIPKFSIKMPADYHVALAFPPDPGVKNLKSIREMHESGSYPIGRKYMEKLIEVFGEEDGDKWPENP